MGMSRAKMPVEAREVSLFILGVILVTVGLAFKIAAVPFHMWVPDAYEGAPTPITAFLSTASKAAGFVALTGVYCMCFLPLGTRWATLLAILSVASMTLGDVAAILQDNVKRMLAYSSIAHAGYVLLGLIAVGQGDTVETREYGLKAVLLYLLIYTFVNFGAFTMVIILRREQVAGDRVADFAGLARRAPGAAVATRIFMLSLARIPATARVIGQLDPFCAVILARHSEPA